MTELTPETIRKVAHLARLKLNESEVASLTRQLGDVLHYVEMLNEVDTSAIEPLAHPFDLTNVLRADEPTPSLPRTSALANAPKTDGKYFLVAQILDAEG